MSKVKQKHTNHVTSPLMKEIHNPFSELSQTSYRDRSSKKSPKHSKRSGKCFQLVLICQKLLKPFSSSSKVTQHDISKQGKSGKEKSKSAQDINAINRQLSDQTTAVKPLKVDACIQTSRESLPEFCRLMLEDGYDTNQGSDDFPYDVDESLKEPFWDLDIDSAIVGDFNSMSTFSLDEQIDPHYATIKMTADGRFIDKPQCAADNGFFGNIYPDDKISYQNSCTSSPKSGIYSKILKPKKSVDCPYPKLDYYRLQSGSRMNFDKIMSLRHQLGLSIDLGQTFPSSDSNIGPTDTPDIPLRSYGSSVINYVAKLRQDNSTSLHSCINSSLVCRDHKLSSTNLYSPIWFTERSALNNATEHLVLPTSEPVAPKRSIKKILQHLNPTYLDDSSEDASIMSMTAPSKSQYSYPRHFSDSNKHCHALDELNRFGHVDCELGDGGKFGSKNHVMDIVSDVVVPLDVTGDVVHLLCDSGDRTLQSLMERSCEEEYFKRDMLSSLDYINNV